MQHKIILKNQDKTAEIESYKLKNGILKVKFRNQEKIYSYTKENFKILEVEELSQSGLSALEYLKQVALVAGIKGDDEKPLLSNEYAKIPSEKLQSIRKTTHKNPPNALFAYLNAKSTIATYRNDKTITLPLWLKSLAIPSGQKRVYKSNQCD